MCHSCCGHSNRVAFLHVHSTFTFLSAFRVHICFSFSKIFECFFFFCYLHPLSTSLFPRFIPTSPSDLDMLSLNLQSPLWSAPVRCQRAARARCGPTARLGGFPSPWWRWRRSRSYPGHASLNTSGSSTCFSSERRHLYERYDCGKRLHVPPDLPQSVGIAVQHVVCVFPLQEGGVSGFLHTFIAEVFSMVRAHVAALGGNAVVSYSMKECMLMENPNKNQVILHKVFSSFIHDDTWCLHPQTSVVVVHSPSLFPSQGSVSH